MRDCYTLRGKAFCDVCWNKLLDAHPELGELDFDDTGSTWQIPDPAPKERVRIPWKTILPEVFPK